MYKKGFILLETLLALALSAGIMVSMMNTYTNADKIKKKMEAMLRLNKEACLLFNQMERDFSTALIGPFSQDFYQTPTTEAKKEVSDKKEQQPIQFFYASFDGDLQQKKEQYTMKMLNKVSIINSNPFLIYQEPKQRLVRVLYHLVPQFKNVKDPKTQRYTLTRYETTDLANTEVKKQVQRKTQKDETSIIYEHTLNNNLVSLYLFFHFPPDPQEKKDAEAQSKRSATAQLPLMVDIECTLEDSFSGMQATFEASFPTIASTELTMKKDAPQNPQTPDDQKQKPTEQNPEQAKKQPHRTSRGRP